MSSRKVVPVDSTADSIQLSEEDLIRERAYAFYEQRGCEPGHELDDWLRAETEIQARKPNRAEITSKARRVAAA